jgi:hypothetical protein
MLRKLMPVIVVDAILILLFVIGNYSIWDELNSEPNMLRSVKFGPYWIQDSHMGSLVNGSFSPVNGIVVILNFPFWLFFVTLAVNLYFMTKLAKTKTTENKKL